MSCLQHRFPTRLLLQYDNSNREEIGEERIKNLVSTSPDLNNGKDREKIVKGEIENQKNNQLTITKTINRLGDELLYFHSDKMNKSNYLNIEYFDFRNIEVKRNKVSFYLCFFKELISYYEYRNSSKNFFGLLSFRKILFYYFC
jgi:hypothetical protein